MEPLEHPLMAQVVREEKLSAGLAETGAVPLASTGQTVRPVVGLVMKAPPTPAEMVTAVVGVAQEALVLVSVRLPKVGQAGAGTLLEGAAVPDMGNLVMVEMVTAQPPTGAMVEPTAPVTAPSQLSPPVAGVEPMVMQTWLNSSLVLEAG